MRTGSVFFALTTAVGLVGALMASSCNKEEASAPVNEPIVMMEPKAAPAWSNYMFGMTGGSGTIQFQVHRGTDASSANVAAISAPFNLVPFFPPYAGQCGFTTPGQTVLCGGITDPSYGVFLCGNTYHIVPNQFSTSPVKILRLTVNASLFGPAPGGGAWFTYNKTTNTWSAAGGPMPGSNAFSTYSQVTSVNWVNC